MKRTMKVQKKLTVIVIMVLLTIAALGTSTYAWFTLSNTAKVDQIDMGITSGVGIDLSLDATEGWTNKVWKSKLTNEDFNDLIKDVKLDAVTSHDGKSFYLKNSDVALDKSSNKYIELDIYFRASNVISFNEVNKKAGVYLVDYNDSTYSEDNSQLGGGTTVTSKGIVWKADTTFKYSADKTLKPGDSETYYARDAIRLGFTRDDTNSVIFDLSTSSTADNYRGYNYEYGAADYYKVKNNLESIEKSTETQTVVFNDQLSKIDEKAEADKDTSLISVLSKDGEYYYGKTTLRIWIEGWDGDCFNSILSDKIQAQLKFQFGIYDK